MTTFSQLVDSIVREVRRPDLLSEVVTYLNQTLREVHFTTDAKSQAIMYRENFTESMLTATVETGFAWMIPDSTTFQAMQVVKYPFCRSDDPYPPEVVPSRGLRGKHQFYYRAGNQYLFSGYGGQGAQIAIGYYAYPRRLKYYPVGQRPGEYDSDMGWTYAPSFDVDANTRLAAQAFTTNWLLLRWLDVLSEGVRAKVYKRVSDTDRARTCYSLYSSLRQGLYSSECADLGGYA